ncbi:MAG: TlpA disulfide reductase family protein [Acidobacteria bacterium]|nr:TlpA disulfide reductase family protein [Acidobacteriota bacterium]
MKHRQESVCLLLLALALGAVLPLSAEAPSPFDFTATNLDGTAFSGRSLAGKAVLLDFWGTWCAPCIHAFPKLRQLHADFGDRLTVVGMAFYSGELEDVAAAAAEHELDYTVLMGAEETLGQFEIFAFPSYVMISADGEILFTQAGQMADLYERVAAYFP